MLRLCLFLLLVGILAPGVSYAQVNLADRTTAVFATLEEGKQILTVADDFVLRQSPFDRAARMKTDKEVSQQDYLDFVGRNVLAWTDTEKQKVSLALEGLREKLAVLSVPLPEKVYLVKTTGDEEGGAPYTRANAIVFPKATLADSKAGLQRLISHELFHVISRLNPQLRDKLYAAIGFVKCDEVEFPDDLRARKLTNPDAPRNDHCIRLEVDGKAYWAIPILFSSTEKYDVARGGEFFTYLQFRFLLVERGPATRPIDDGGKARMVDMQEVSGFFEQVGRNTGYVIHPEEILADNFALLVVGTRNARSPEILEKLRKLLTEPQTPKTAEPSAPAISATPLD